MAVVFDIAHLELMWAKSDPFHSVPCHCIDVGMCAQAILQAPAFRRATSRLEAALGLSLKDGLLAWIGYLCACHDLGKCDPHFQGKVPELTAALAELGYFTVAKEQCAGFRHEWLSADFLGKQLKAMGWGKHSCKVAKTFVKAHHGNFYPKEHTRGILWQSAFEALHAQLQSVFSPPEWAPRAFPHQGQASLLLCGLLVFADWIASNSDFFGLHKKANETYNEYALRSQLRAQECLTELNLWDVPQQHPIESFEQAWPGFSPRPLQTACVELLSQVRQPGLLIAEAPMGEGKSELAIFAALRLGQAEGEPTGFYVALPTGATSNQMYSRVRDFLKNYAPDHEATTKLVHGAAWLVENADEHQAQTPDSNQERRWTTEWFRPRRRSLLCPFAVGTVDQAMMAALNVKFGFLRWLGLAKGSLIIDEVHAYDAYMNTIIVRLLEWCGSLRIPVILLSATLPSQTKSTFVTAYTGSTAPPPAKVPEPYPLLSFHGCDGDDRYASSEATKKNQLTVEMLPGGLSDPLTLVDKALAETAEGGVACILANTVKTAQYIFRKLEKEADSDTQTLLFHARFRAGDRQALEEQVLELFDKGSSLDVPAERRRERPAKAILVATQVVEQSLDIDFDVMLSEIAPVDLLLQRSGRVHRHRRDRTARLRDPRLLVATPAHEEWGGTGMVYEELILLKTLALIEQKCCWNCPEDFRHLIEEVYTPNSEVELTIDPAALARAKAAFLKLQTEMEAAGALALLNPPNERVAELVGDNSNSTDEEGEHSNALIARTRYGKDSVTLYLLDHSPELERITGQKERPRLDTLRALLLNKVSVQFYWLQSEPDGDYKPVQEAPSWLGFGKILWLKDSQWRGTTPQGKSVLISYSNRYGLTREVVTDGL